MTELRVPFKAGDKVWVESEGNCMIKHPVNNAEEYPLDVRRVDGTSVCSYTRDGKLYATDRHPTLFHGHRENTANKHDYPVRKVTMYMNIFWHKDRGTTSQSYLEKESAQMAVCGMNPDWTLIVQAQEIEVPE